jgi:3-methyladenine DNA glycosylase AlkC
MSNALQEIKDYRKKVLVDLYSQCTKPQQEIFKKMYNSIETIPDKNIDWAIQQCERTIIKNRKRLLEFWSEQINLKK